MWYIICMTLGRTDLNLTQGCKMDFFKVVNLLASKLANGKKVTARHKSQALQYYKIYGLQGCIDTINNNNGFIDLSSKPYHV